MIQGRTVSNIGLDWCSDTKRRRFKCKQPLEAMSKINSCLSDIRRWMVTNKLKINYSKTEFIGFPQLKCDLSGLSMNVGKYRLRNHQM